MGRVDRPLKRKQKAAGQRETTPRAIRHTHDLLSPQPNRWMSQLNASRAVHVVLDITVVVSRLVRGLILSTRGEVSPHLRWAFSGRRASALDGFAVTGHIAAWGPPRRRACTAIAADPHTNQAT